MLSSVHPPRRTSSVAIFILLPRIHGWFFSASADEFRGIYVLFSSVHPPRRTSSVAIFILLPRIHGWFFSASADEFRGIYVLFSSVHPPRRTNSMAIFLLPLIHGYFFSAAVTTDKHSALRFIRQTAGSGRTGSVAVAARLSCFRFKSEKMVL
jgi:hypothetical protein